VRPSPAHLLGTQGDVEATMFVVMMEAAKSPQEDLKAIMSGVKAINAAKRPQRELIAKINRDVVAAMVAEAERTEIEFSPQGLERTAGDERIKTAIPDPEAPERVRFAHVRRCDASLATSSAGARADLVDPRFRSSRSREGVRHRVPPQ